MFARSIVCATVVGVAALCLPGCGGSGGAKLAHVHGTITYKGKPIPNGTILFIPKDGPTATGNINPDGTYTLTTYKAGDGAMLGVHKIVINAMENMAGRLPEDRNPLPPSLVPNKYSSIATTDLTGDVKDQDNTIDFPLNDPKK